MNPPKSRHAIAILPVLALLVSSLFNAGCGKGGQAGSAAASPSPTAPPAMAPAAATAAPTPDESLPKYSGAQQSRYIRDAEAAFVTQRNAKFQPFLQAQTAFETAGGISPAGLTQESITQRLDLLGKVQAAQDDYTAFITSQADVYRVELAKTPLIPADVDANVATFVEKANIPRQITAQQLEKDLLACSAEMLGDLQKWNGAWEITGGGKLSFKKKPEKATYIALEGKYNAIVAQINQLHPVATPAASPDAAGAATAAPAPTATP